MATKNEFTPQEVVSRYLSFKSCELNTQLREECHISGDRIHYNPWPAKGMEISISLPPNFTKTQTEKVIRILTRAGLEKISRRYVHNIENPDYPQYATRKIMVRKRS
jgi:hypothetical protein